MAQALKEMKEYVQALKKEFTELKVPPPLTFETFLKYISAELKKLKHLKKIYSHNKEIKDTIRELEAHYAGLQAGEIPDEQTISKLQKSLNKFIRYNAQAYVYFLHQGRSRDMDRVEKFHNYMRLQQFYYLFYIEPVYRDIKLNPPQTVPWKLFIRLLDLEIRKLHDLYDVLGTRMVVLDTVKIGKTKNGLAAFVKELMGMYMMLQKGRNVDVSRLIELQKGINKYLKTLARKKEYKTNFAVYRYKKLQDAYYLVETEKSE